MTSQVSVAERENPWRKRLRIESDPVKRGRLLNELILALKSADDNDAARNTVEFIGSQCVALEGSWIGHGRFPLLAAA